MSSYTADFTTTRTLPLVRSARRQKNRSLSAHLVVLQSPKEMDSQKLFSLKGQVILGRKPSADIFINDSKLSRIHAQIYCNEGHYFIKDLNSTNGTKVNGKFITEKRIYPKDIIEIGNMKFEFNFPQLMTRKKNHEGPTSFFEKSIQILKYLLLGTVFAVCIAFIYFSATHPFSKERVPQSIQESQKEIAKTGDWISTQADLFYKLSQQAYQEGNYSKAKQYWREASGLKPASTQYENLGHAIEEAIVLKRIYIDKLEERKQTKLYQHQIEELFQTAERHIQNKDWNLAIIAYQDILLIDPDHEWAKAGINRIESLQIERPGLIESPPHPNTLTRYNQIQKEVEQGETLEEEKRFTLALKHYKSALQLAQTYDLSTEPITAKINQTSEILKSESDKLWQEVLTFQDADHTKEAYDRTQAILHMNPTHTKALTKGKELKLTLHHKAQKLYSQAIIFEALPDIASAKLQWTEITLMLDPSDHYYKRASEKLSKYSSY